MQKVFKKKTGFSQTFVYFLFVHDYDSFIIAHILHRKAKKNIGNYCSWEDITKTIFRNVGEQNALIIFVNKCLSKQYLHAWFNFICDIYVRQSLLGITL